ncbi:MAG: hypothetical protein WC289_02795 [Patescibacteria group bacterium]|jgi:hypothetical protein
MVRKRFIFGGIGLILCALGVQWRMSRITYPEPVFGKVEGVATEESITPAETTPAPVVESDGQTANIESPVEEEIGTVPVYADFFRLTYIAKFTGAAEPDPLNTFTHDDRMILVVRTRPELKTKEMLRLSVVKGDKEISAVPPIEILNGEIGLQNPGFTGSYILRVIVGDTEVERLPFVVR